MKDVVMLVVLRVIFRPLVNELPGFGAFTYSIRKNVFLLFLAPSIVDAGRSLSVDQLQSSRKCLQGKFLDALTCGEFGLDVFKNLRVQRCVL